MVVFLPAEFSIAVRVRVSH